MHKAPGDDYPSTVSDAFDVLGKAHDDGDSAWGLLLEIQNPKKDSRRVVITESEVHGDNRKMRSKLAHNGLHIEYGGVLFEKLMMSLKADELRHDRREAGLDRRQDAVCLS